MCVDENKYVIDSVGNEGLVFREVKQLDFGYRICWGVFMEGFRNNCWGGIFKQVLRKKRLVNVVIDGEYEYDEYYLGIYMQGCQIQ